MVFDPAEVSYEELLKVFWEAHDPTQGMRQGNDVGTQYRSAIYTHGPEQAKAAAASRDAYQKVLTKAGLRRDHHRDRPRRRVLLCGGLPPAVPLQEPERLLRHRRHRRLLPVGLTPAGSKQIRWRGPVAYTKHEAVFLVWSMGR